MIRKINEASVITANSDGDKAFILYKAFTLGLNIISTLILDKKLFYRYLQDGTIGDEVAHNIKHQLSDNKSGDTHVFIRTSNKKQPGMLGSISCSNSLEAIKYSIEKIYRSWSLDQQVTYRIVNSLSDEATAPIIMIQPFVTTHHTMTTKHPKTGESTSILNFNDHIHCNLERINEEHLKIISLIDKIQPQPTKVFFDDSFRIFAISSISCTRRAILFSMINWLQRSQDDKPDDIIDLLLNIRPDDIVQTEITRNCHGVFFEFSGIAASPGTSYGKIITRSTYNDREKNFIFLCDDYLPLEGDFEILNSSSGIITLSGGVTCHAAVVARALRKPAITGANNIIFNEDSISIGGNTFTVKTARAEINGSSGKGHIGDFEIFHKNRYKFNICNEHISLLINIIDNIIKYGKFANLPIYKQNHISSLLRLTNLAKGDER